MSEPGIFNVDPAQDREFEQEQARAAEFGVRLAATRHTYVTFTLLAINVLVFVLMAISGVSVLEPTTSSLLKWGADYGPLTTQGQWWRLMTSTVIHIGIIHLVMNMFVLLNIGLFTEKLFGNAGFTVLYLLSGLGGSLTSLAWHPTTVSAGASGAIFGLYGGMLGFLLVRRSAIPKETVASLGKGALFFVGYNVLYGAGKSGIDMSAHLGGLLTGAIVGAALAQPLSEVLSEGRTRRSMIVAVCGVLLAGIYITRIPRLDDLRSEQDRYAAIESKAIDLYNASLKQWKADKLSSEGFADVLDKQVLPPWNAELNAMLKLKRLPPDQLQVAQAFTDYMKARGEGWALMAQAARKESPALMTQANQKSAEADTLLAQLNEKQR
jgi:rhomboid protease GluP